MTATYLKRFYFDDAKLRDRAFSELVRAFSTLRVVAFVGSMATESRGYGDWKTLVRDYMKAAKILADVPDRFAGVKAAQSTIKAICARLKDDRLSKLIEKQVMMSIAKEALALIDAFEPWPEARATRATDMPAPPTGALAHSGSAAKDRADEEQMVERVAQCCVHARSRVDALDRFAAAAFGAPDPDVAASSQDEGSALHKLITELGIRRYATLNYDLEIEAELMLEPDDFNVAGAQDDSHRGYVQKFGELIRQGKIRGGDSALHRMTRLMSNGHTIESDIRDRERPDRLIEFAVGSADVDYRIMHLHGRSDAPETMIVGLRDYDRLYRKHDLARLPFEHGQRILFAGNPVLFVGVGMSEPEVNNTLQHFVSNNPYRRFAPTFLLWSTAELSADTAERRVQMKLRRLDFLQRLGVFTIFDEDIFDHLPGQRTKDLRGRLDTARLEHEALEKENLAGKKAIRKEQLSILAQTIPLLASAGADIDRKASDFGKAWRSLEKRLSRVPGPKPMALWGTAPSGAAVPLQFGDCFSAGPRGSGVPHRVVVAPAGSGKGELGWQLVESRLPPDFDAPLGSRLIINAGYAFDTDFLLLAISRFLLKLKGSGDWKTGPKQSRETQFEEPDAFKLPQKALIVINGMERFFTVGGAPLSAELDHLLRRVARERRGDARWIFLGTPRIERYFRNISREAIVPITSLRRAEYDPHDGEPVASVYFNHLIKAIGCFAKEHGKDPEKVPDSAQRIIMNARASGDPHQVRRSVLGAYLNAKALGRAGLVDEIALEILRAMAFIGSPVEATVLLHVPRIRERLTTQGEIDSDRLLRNLRDLNTMRFITQITQFEDYPGNGEGLWARYGLHSAIMAELRYQFGIPASESKLSTSFNMSLYIAQPVDGYVPEAALHDELGKLIDHLIGACKDALLSPETGGREDEGLIEAEQRQRDRCTPAAAAALRAALSVVRSYYCTTSLLTIDRDDRMASDDRDGVLLEHAERLETLLRAFGKQRKARAAIIAGEGREPEWLGPEPFYPDDLVWLHNELGVVYLAQGDLYSARRSFALALQINRDHVEYRCRSHNWRRITMNQVALDTERATLTAAELKLGAIEDSINRRANVQEDPSCRFDYIRTHFGGGTPPDRGCFDPDIMHEELLMAGLTLGHRGLCKHIRGHLRMAEPLYRDAIAILGRLGEHRAYAFFQRHMAQLAALLEPEQEQQGAIRLAVTAAESVRQMDMAYHARVVAADRSWRSSKATADTRRQALRDLTAALAYAAVMDLYRLRVEAGICLSRLQFESGDYETALEHAAEAMALAARYGMSLRKISLRLDIGWILIRRGDPKSGAALIERAVEAADRFGYQRAVEWAQKIRVIEGVPG